MNRLIGSIALISGTAIGAGMLSLPVVTAQLGFFPSTLLFIGIDLLMAYVALLILEVLSILKPNATMISMAEDTMGKWGKKAATLSYFFLLLALNIAYLSASTGQILGFWQIDSTLLSRFLIGAILSFGCGGLAAAHTQKVDRVNRILFVALIACFGAMLVTLLPTAQLTLLTTSNYSHILMPLALILTSFGYHPIIPNIFDYLDRDVKKTKLAILVGTIIPLVVYLLWQVMVLGNVSLEGPRGLLWAMERGYPATNSLEAAVPSSHISLIINSFAFFAIMTSFLGTMLALAEFVADACGWPINDKTRPKVAFAVAAPLLAFCMLGAKLFINALGYAGIFAAILLGCLPVVMAALSRRQHKNMARPYLVKGGYSLMITVFICFSFIILVELFSHL